MKTIIKVPPIKCQGIKTKLVEFISENVIWNKKGKWIEPFLGSGVVAFNIHPEKAFLADTNKHIITLYKDIQSGSVTPPIVKEYLEKAAKLLKENGQEYYYDVRKKFNENSNTLDFIFLNRASFNGVMRFNKKGGFNVPFNHKLDRFRQAYITKIINQIAWVEKQMNGKEWIFSTSDWRKTLSNVTKDDFVYLDPPYIGRHTDYFNQWSENDADDLANMMKKLPCNFAYSMWKENIYRKNEHITKHWKDFRTVTFSHFYHVGAKEELRNKMEEALIMNY
jgi:DNA adenine methylase